MKRLLGRLNKRGSGKGILSRKDVLLVIAILSAAILLYFVLGAPGQAEGGQIRVVADGQEYGTYSLGEDRVIEIVQDCGRNVIHIEGGYAWMEEADCPDGYCMRQGRIHQVKQSVICLPHRLVVEVLTADSEQAEKREEAGETLPDAVVH